MARKIAVVGTGYVGLIAAVGLADFGNTVIALDVEVSKIARLNKGETVIYEPGVEEYLRRNLQARRLEFSTDIARGIRDSEVIFIAVGTPAQDSGEADLSALDSLLPVIAANLHSYKVIVTKSTVPIGTNRRIAQHIKELLSGAVNFDVVSNPEFLREGKAIQDFFHPDRIVIGVESVPARAIMEDIYRALNIVQVPFIWCGLETAEMIKYAANTFLATKITFINQLANLAESVGADIHDVTRAMGKDGRISSKFLHPGPGYGGSCFPKDTKALIHIGRQNGVELSLLKEVVQANENQKRRIVQKLLRLLPDLSGKTVALLGLAFKAETDDVRESPVITIVEELLKREVKIKAHDPKAINNFKAYFKSIEYAQDMFEAVTGADALIICTEWNEYRSLDLARVKNLMQGRVILDTRNILDIKLVKEAGFIYEGVGRR